MQPTCNSEVTMNILVPVDFSCASRRGLCEASRWARRLGGRLHLAHVMTGVVGPILAQEPGVLCDSTVEHRVKTLELMFAEELEGLDHQIDVFFHQDVASVLREHAGHMEADLIIMGTHGRQGVERWFLGSVTETLVATAPCPVLAVPRCTETKKPQPEEDDYLESM